MIAIARETFAQVRAEIWPLFETHYAEVAEDQDAVPLDMDWEAYDRLDAAGALVIVAARKDGALVGYTFALVGPHLHHRSTVLGQMDLYYLRPDCRGGRTAFRLFRETERAVRDAGAVRFTTGTMLARDHGRLFRRMGWRDSERMLTKIMRAA